MQANSFIIKRDYKAAENELRSLINKFPNDVDSTISNRLKDIERLQDEQYRHIWEKILKSIGVEL